MPNVLAVASSNCSALVWLGTPTFIAATATKLQEFESFTFTDFLRDGETQGEEEIAEHPCIREGISYCRSLLKPLRRRRLRPLFHPGPLYECCSLLFNHIWP